MAQAFASRIRRALAVSALAACALTQGVQAETFRVEDMIRGVNISSQQCSTIARAVWVNQHGYGFCIRYYLSTAGGESGKPIVFLQGDQFGALNLRTGTFEVPNGTKDTESENLIRLADNMSRGAKGPAIYLARIGVDGSSGHHRLRRTVLELHTINAALDLIRARHNFEGFHLVGQSGGSGLIGGLLALRSDIVCAVPGAGRLSLLRKARESGDPAKDYFDPNDAIGLIAANRGARIIVVTDQNDKVVPAQHQTAFVNALRREGRFVEQYFVTAIDQKNHGVLAYAARAVVLCAQNAPATRISTDLDLLVQKRLASVQQQRTPVVGGEGPRVDPAPAPASAPVLGGSPQPVLAPAGVRTDWPRLPPNHPARQRQAVAL